MPAKSKKQQQFMGMVHAYQRGDLSPREVSPDIIDAARSMTKQQVKDFAETKHKNLPNRVKKAKANYVDKASYIFSKLARRRNSSTEVPRQDVKIPTGNSLLKSTLPGAIAGGFSTAVTYPIDTLQIMKQTQTFPKGGLKLKNIPRLYKGIGLKMLKIVPTTALSFAAYDFIKKKLR